MMVGTRFDLMVDLAEKVERQLLDFSNVNNIIYDETSILLPDKYSFAYMIETRFIITCSTSNPISIRLH